MRCLLLTFFFSVLLNAQTLFPQIFIDEIESNYHHFGIERPFDFEKAVTEPKFVFPIIKDFLNFPSKNFTRMNTAVSDILDMRFYKIFSNKQITKYKKLRITKQKDIDEIISILGFLDENFKKLKDTLNEEDINKLLNYVNENIEAAYLYELSKKMNIFSYIKLYEHIIELSKKIDWDSLAEMDEEGFIYCGPSPEKNNYLLTIDRSSDDIEIEKDAFAARMYVKTGDVKNIYGDPAKAICGLSVFISTSKKDTSYRGLSGMSALLGFSYFRNEHGNNIYNFDQYALASAVFGISVMEDMEGNDTYISHRLSQAFSSTAGIALLKDYQGNDNYIAGGKYLHEPLYADRYQSLSQGFSIGDRYADFGGGISILYDESGNDNYNAEVYAQGSGYWYAMGILMDMGGNDNYKAHIYGQGAGIHLACGILLDNGGSNTFSLLDGVGLGGGHDLAIGILMSMGEGNDAYQGSGITMGAGNANGVGIFFDEGGDDSYSGVRDNIIGSGNPARSSASFGIFIDSGGNDKYPDERFGNNQIWYNKFFGVGIDHEK